MKIELKNFKFYERLSEETNCFVADLYVNGVKCASVKNEGHGGCTDYWHYEGKKELMQQAEQYCLTLPPIKYGTFVLSMNLEHFIDNLVEIELEKKEL